MAEPIRSQTQQSALRGSSFQQRAFEQRQQIQSKKRESFSRQLAVENTRFGGESSRIKSLLNNPDYIVTRRADGSIASIKQKEREYVARRRGSRRDTKKYSPHVLTFDEQGNLIKEVRYDTYRTNDKKVDGERRYNNTIFVDEEITYNPNTQEKFIKDFDDYRKNDEDRAVYLKREEKVSYQGFSLGGSKYRLDEQYRRARNVTRAEAQSQSPIQAPPQKVDIEVGKIYAQDGKYITKTEEGKLYESTNLSFIQSKTPKVKEPKLIAPQKSFLELGGAYEEVASFQGTPTYTPATKEPLFVQLGRGQVVVQQQRETVGVQSLESGDILLGPGKVQSVTRRDTLTKIDILQSEKAQVVELPSEKKEKLVSRTKKVNEFLVSKGIILEGAPKRFVGGFKEAGYAFGKRVFYDIPFGIYSAGKGVIRGAVNEISYRASGGAGVSSSVLQSNFQVFTNTYLRPEKYPAQAGLLISGAFSSYQKAAEEKPLTTIGETAGTVAAFPIYEYGFTQVKNIYVITGSRYVPKEQVFAQSVLSGSENLPTTKSIQESVKRFRATKTETGTFEVVTASPSKIKDTTVGVGKKASGGLEDPGIYVSPKGEGSPYFLRLMDEKPKDIEFSFNPAENLFSVPTVTKFEVQDIVRYPRKVIKKPGFTAVSQYQDEVLSSQGVAVITKRSELGQGVIPRQKFTIPKGTINPFTEQIRTKSVRVTEAGTSEIEAVIPKGSEFAYKPTSGIAKIKGFEEFTIYNGRAVALRETEVLSKKAPTIYREDIKIISEKQIKRETSAVSDISRQKVSVNILGFKSSIRPSKTRYAASYKSSFTSYIPSYALSATSYANSYGSSATSYANSYGSSATSYANSYGSSATSYANSYGSSATSYANSYGSSATSYANSYGSSATSYANSYGLSAISYVSYLPPVSTSKKNQSKYPQNKKSSKKRLEYGLTPSLAVLGLNLGKINKGILPKTSRVSRISGLGVRFG